MLSGTMDGGAWGTWTAIALGSAAGGLLRQLMTEAITQLAGGSFPWGTLAVNVCGSAAMGACAALSMAAVPSSWSPVARHATMTGVLGGFTTFSTFSMQTMALVHQGQWWAAAANVLASVALSVLFCGVGYASVSAAVATLR